MKLRIVEVVGNEVEVVEFVLEYKEGIGGIVEVEVE